MTEPLLHLVPASGFDPEAREPYAPTTPGQEDRVHCASVAQVAGVARLLFAGTEDLLLLVIDPRALGEARVVDEDVYGIGQSFPVVHGSIPRSSIVEVRPYPPGRGGRWSRPDVEPLS